MANELSRLKNRIKRENFDRWNRLEEAGWKCSECGKEYSGRSMLVVIPRLGNKVLCKRCASLIESYDMSSKKLPDSRIIFDEILREGNMSDVARKYSVSRERIRQILTKLVTEDIEKKLYSGEIENLDDKDIKQLVKEEIKEISTTKIKRRVEKKLTIAAEKGTIPERYSSKTDFARDVGVNLKFLKLFFPDVINKIRANSLVGYGGRRWSRYYLRCRKCGTTTIHHHSQGYCEECYPKTEMFKNMQRASRLRNMDRWKPRINQYLKDYYDKKSYDGNRQKTLERDKNRCVRCHIDQAKSQEKYREELRVAHLGNKKDNSLSNLATMCRKCFMKLLAEKRRYNLAKNLLLF